MSENMFVEILQFTDPVCTWCWGSEPLLRKVETRYQGQVRIKYVMGGLVKDIKDFFDSHNNIGGDPEQSNTQIAHHWLDASQRHGMPVKVEGFKLFTNEDRSTYPQNIAYKAAEMEDVGLANRFLRRVREASAAESRQTNKTEILIELATEVGLDVPKFIERFTDGSALKAFKDDLYTVSQYGVRGFPTFLVKYGERESLMRGYQSYDAFRAVIDNLTGGTINDKSIDKTDDNLLAFVGKYDRVAPVEIQEALGYTSEDLARVLDNLKKRKVILRIPAGNGEFIELANSPMACDSATGICKM
jgi:putative protein-disulfide isomerase